MATDFPGVGQAELQARGAEWTAREIAQQPSVWPQVEQLVAGQRAQLDIFLQPLLARSDLRIVLSGAGTSSFIGDCLLPALSARLQRRVESIATTELVSGPHLRFQSDVPTLLVSFARSGNSPESIAAVEFAERALADVHHLIVTCNVDGELAKRARNLGSAHTIVLPEVTHDRGFAMTSSFTSMLLTAALAFGAVRPEAISALATSVSTVLQRAWPVVQRFVAREFQRVVYLGSNELRGLASEAALKLLELTDGRVVALADSTLGFRHGPKTIINDRTLVVVMLSNDSYTRAYDLELLAELRRDARAGAILALSGSHAGLPEGDNVIYDGLRDASDLELALAHIAVGQTYALLQSLALGLTPDRPNAAGVVNRVVQGVNIHPWSGQRDVSRR
ncbi:SIS domain-containing protein [Steroidobacter sp.]|uniref:SIS domain-containing protein n=1 Tax=Steroidobacter sp. TaxID=1978227 RepID=UPI001A638591|nr:SIS domain-containing protein [Steroidobacter sp.]MBL8271287.1 SIS domain-containing protein [Steroidobacter sp.]